MTSEQLRAARAMLRMEQAALAKAAGVSVETVKRLERLSGDLADVRVATIRALQSALEAAGVEFIPENGGGAGVRMRKMDMASRMRARIGRIRSAIEFLKLNAPAEVQQAIEDLASRQPKTASTDTLDGLIDIFENVRGRALLLVKAGVAKRGDFPEIDINVTNDEAAIPETPNGEPYDGSPV